MKKIDKKIGNRKPDSSYAWASLILSLFFWLPLLNMVILPASIYFGVKAMARARKRPEKYSGFALAFFSVIFASTGLVIGTVILVLAISGRI